MAGLGDFNDFVRAYHLEHVLEYTWHLAVVHHFEVVTSLVCLTSKIVCALFLALHFD